MDINEMKYWNKRKTKTSAYILGSISWFLPLALHKLYLGMYEWFAVYLTLILTVILVPNTPISDFALIVYTLLMLYDVIKTSMDVTKYNEGLVEEILGDNNG